MKKPHVAIKNTAKNLKSRVVILNVISSILLQIATVCSGFIIPHIILETFGSETNGLVSSLNQFLNYISLVEGGLTGVILANLYRPVAKKAFKKVSGIIRSAQRFYNRLAIIFVIYTIILAFSYPLFVNTSFNYDFVVSLTFILSLNLFIQYVFAITWRQLLQSDKKVYIVSFVQIACIAVNLIGTIILAKVWPSIHILKLFNVLAFLIQPIAYHFYINKHYPLDKNVEPDKKALSQRWDGFGINIAAFIHFNTDIVILTVFTDLLKVSVYSVHALVTTGLRNIIQAISDGFTPSIGQAYAKDDPARLNKLFNSFEFIMTFVTFFFFLMGGLLITPFITYYTNGIGDVNYYEPIFAVLLILGEFIYCIREPYVALAYSANRFKAISKYAYVEAALNIILSIILVFPLGLIGIAIGTLISMTYRTITQILYLKHHILHFSLKPRIKTFLIFSAFSVLAVFLSMNLLSYTEVNLVSWIILALENLGIVLLCYLPMLALFFRSEVKALLDRK